MYTLFMPLDNTWYVHLFMTLESECVHVVHYPVHWRVRVHAARIAHDTVEYIIVHVAHDVGQYMFMSFWPP